VSDNKSFKTERANENIDILHFSFCISESLPIRFFFLRNRCLSRFVFLGSGIYLSPGCSRSSACVTGLLAQLRLRYWAV
jgi:hypothetical protein